MLKTETFTKIIENTPLISIDLIIKNSNNKILLGKRVNEPAKDYWFVPGGCIFKNESLEDAFSRICQSEIGVSLRRNETIFYGHYEHFYKNNVFNDKFGTHYIVLAHQVHLENISKVNDQHTAYHWFKVNELLAKNSVHQYTKNYFTGE